MLYDFIAQNPAVYEPLLHDSNHNRDVTDKGAQYAGMVYSALLNDGLAFDPVTKEPERYTINDLVTSEQLQWLVPKAIQQITYDALMPALNILPALFTKVRLPEMTTTLQINALGEIEAGKVSEAGEYPEQMFSGQGGEAIRVVTEKFGLQISLTEEAVQFSQFDIVNMWLEKAGRALARLKEKQAAALLSEMGIVFFDNFNPVNGSELGRLTGRDIHGIQNGSMTYEDLMEMYLYLVMNGFQPDTIIIHPLAFRIWQYDTTTRELLESGVQWNPFQGNTSPGWNSYFGGLGLRTQATGSDDPTTNAMGKIGAWPWTTEFNPLGMTMHTQPKGLFGNMRVIVSPYMPFTRNGGEYTTHDTEGEDLEISNIDICDIAMVDSKNTGIYFENYSVRQKAWEDPAHDIRYLRLGERYGMQLMNQGKAVAIAKNVLINRNYAFENVNSVNLVPLVRGTESSTGTDLNPSGIGAAS